MIDASVAVKWFVEEDGRERAMRVFSRPDELAAPDLVILEVCKVLRRRLRAGTVVQHQLHNACETMRQCFARLIVANDLIEQTVRLATELDHSIYDCAYLACAISLGAPLLTADERFLTKVVRTGRLSPHITSLSAF